MPAMRLIKHCAEFLAADKLTEVPGGTRGIYVLLKQGKPRGRKEIFDVVYIGMSGRGVKGRLREHRRKKHWTHFSVYSVWPNVSDDEVAELEGLFRAIFRKDANANKIAVQKGFAKLKEVRRNDFDWTEA
jgi:hypothetical protein